MKITLVQVKRPLLRCEECIGLRAPLDLPLLTARAELTPFTRALGDMSAIGLSGPKRTRGGLKEMAERWAPYKDHE